MNYDNSWVDKTLDNAVRVVQSWPEWMQRPELRAPGSHGASAEVRNLNDYVHYNKGLSYIVTYVDRLGYCGYITRKDMLNCDLIDPIHHEGPSHWNKEKAADLAEEFIDAPWVTENWSPWRPYK